MIDLWEAPSQKCGNVKPSAKPGCDMAKDTKLTVMVDTLPMKGNKVNAG